jgi:hypothetical protein
VHEKHLKDVLPPPIYEHPYADLRHTVIVADGIERQSA